MVRTNVDITSVRKGTYKSKYTLQQLLNEGGNAKVYKCLHNDTEKEYAIKILNTCKVGEKLSRFSNEIRVMQTYGGAANGVLPIIDADPDDGWYVMPVAIPLETYFSENKSSIKDKVDAIAKLAKSLEMLHKKGITHRDIKPDNLFSYEGTYCFGDFGLCEYPEGEEVYTRTDKQLGAFNTIAPEMYKNPQGQDGQKADVYSLAKTLWILLTGDKKGFQGPYSSEDSAISFVKFAYLKEEQLALIELVLQLATDNNPNRRISLPRFSEILERWYRHSSDSRYLQHYEWFLAMEHIVSLAQIDVRHIFDFQQIVYVLNSIANHKILNHVMLPNGGGLDLISVEKANEDGCLYLHLQGQTLLVRPKELVIATFEDSDWDFILLETAEQKPITENHNEYEEFVVEDYPNHYVSGNDAQYGVYDYDSGIELPRGSKFLIRQLQGKFLVVPKFGYYNQITQTYDGRHGKMTAIELYHYIDKLRKGKEPEIEYEPLDMELSDTHDAPFAFTKKYVDEVNVEVKPKQLPRKHRISFAFYVEYPKSDTYADIFLDKRIYLTNEGFFMNLAIDDVRIYKVFTREEAIKMKKFIYQQFEQHYRINGYDFDVTNCSIGVLLRREGDIEPKRFTLEKIAQLMREADDRKNNKLVIDEYGNPHIIQDKSEAQLYPVTQETWQAGNNYVGKYSSLSDVRRSYQYMLEGWLYYIEHFRHIYINESYTTIDELEKKIKEYYNKHTKWYMRLQNICADIVHKML